MQERGNNSVSRSPVAVARFGNGILVPVGEYPSIRVWNMVTRRFDSKLWTPNMRRSAEDADLQRSIDYVGKLLAEKGAFTPVEEIVFLDKVDAHAITTNDSELSDGFFRLMAATLPEVERTPLNVWNVTIRAMRQGFKESA